MEQRALPPATQAVLDALTELGQGNVHELVEKSGKARSTTDRAIKALADAGLIIQVDTDADAAEGTPPKWALAPAPETNTADNQPDGAASGTNDVAQIAEDRPTDGGQSTEPSQESEGPLVDGDDGSQPASDTEDGEGLDNPGEDERDEAGQASTGVPAGRPGDRKVMAIKGVLSDHGDDGVTLDVISRESGISIATVVRLLSAMEQADAARRIPADSETGTPERWIAGPTKASEVDPNPPAPRCPTCGQVIRSTRTPTTTPRAAAGSDMVNSDGNRPFARGELEELTVRYLIERPGQPLTPQDIARGISQQLGGRDISSGAVRNNCTKAAAAGRILLESETPLRFVYPAPPEDADNV